MPRLGLKTPFRSGTLQDLVKQVLAISRDGLKRRAIATHEHSDETCFLTELEEIAASGVTLAEEQLDAFKTRWNGSIDPIYDEFAY